MKLHKFKLVSEDDSCYNLQSPAGKPFIVEKKALSEKAHALIKELKTSKPAKFAEGGKAGNDQEAQEALDKQESDKVNNKADNVILKSYDDRAYGKDPSYEKKKKVRQDLLNPPQEFYDGGESMQGGPGGSGLPLTNDPESMSGASDQTSAISGTDPSQGTVANLPSMNYDTGPDSVNQQNLLAPSDQSAGMSVAPASATPVQTPDEYAKAIEASKAAQLGMAGAEGQAGSAESKAIGQGLNRFDNPKNLPFKQEMIDKNMKLSQDLQTKLADPKNDFNPDRWYGDNKTANKIFAAVGTFLTGGSSGPVGSFIKNAVENDINQQKQDKSDKMNLYKLNLEGTGNAVEANLRTRMQELEAIRYRAAQMQNQYRGPVAQAKAKLLNAELDQQQALLGHISSLVNPSQESTGGYFPNTPEAHQSHLNQLFASSNLSPLLKEAWQDQNKKFIPGVGTTQIIPSAEDKNELRNYDTIKSQLNRALDFQLNGPGSGVGAWDPANKAKGKAIMADVRASVQPIIYNMKRYNPSLAEKFEDSLPNINDINWFSKNSSGLQEMINSVDQRQSSLSDHLGVKPFVKSRLVNGHQEILTNNGWRTVK